MKWPFRGNFLGSQLKGQHNSHVPSSRAWPAVIIVAAINMAGGAIIAWNFNCSINLQVGLFGISGILLVWFLDMYKEMASGSHRIFGGINVRFGMALFIGSEILFFGGFFWGYFHSCLKPEDTSERWARAAYGEVVLRPLGLPLQNTLILLGSGVTCTLAHNCLNSTTPEKTGFWVYRTVGLGAYFVLCQAIEYVRSGFRGNTSRYGTLFFLLTGFHGLHVFLGASLLLLAFKRSIQSNFREEKHVYFEAAVWYWHFVDVVWLGLYLFIYGYGFDLF